MELIHIFLIIGCVVVGTELIAHSLKNMERGRDRNIVTFAGCALLAAVAFVIIADTFIFG